MQALAKATKRPDVPGAEPTISLVIPCLNEEGAIGEVVRKGLRALDALGVPGEVLVVDNGSSDRSVAIARRAGARVVHEPSRGYGSALRRGFAEARGRYVVIADGDDTYPVDDLRPFVKLLDEGYDMVNGNRFGGGIQPGAMTWSHRYLGTPLLSLLLRAFTRTDLADSQCGMRAFRRQALRSLDLRAPGMELASEMLVKAARAGLRIGQVPITLAPRVGESKLQTLPDGWRHLRYLLTASPDHLFLLPGLLLLAFGLAVLGLQAVFPTGLPISDIWWRPEYAGVVLSLIGIQTIWFGLIAKVYSVATRLVATDRLTSWFLARMTLERSLLVSFGFLTVGIIAEFALALQQLDLTPTIPFLGPFGALALLVGVQSFFSSFVIYLLTSDCTGLTSRPNRQDGRESANRRARARGDRLRIVRAGDAEDREARVSIDEGDGAGHPASA